MFGVILKEVVVLFIWDVFDFVILLIINFMVGMGIISLLGMMIG